MGKRVTVVLDDEIDKKLRIYQAKKIKENATSYSFSRVINEILSEIL